MTTKLLTGAVAALGIGLGVASMAVNGYSGQPPTAPPQAPAGQGAGQGQRGGGGGGGGRGRGPAVPLLGPGPSAARFPKNADEFDQMFNQVKNWGRWGPTDQLGAANLITEAVRKKAYTLAKLGVVVGLGHPPLTEMAPDNAQPWEHVMNRGFSTDTDKVSFHGFAHSHIDSLCHIIYKGQVYNGYPTAEVNTEAGCTKNSIENLEKRHRHAGDSPRHPAPEGIAVSRAGNPGVCRRSRGVGKEGQRQGRSR